MSWDWPQPRRRAAWPSSSYSQRRWPAAPQRSWTWIDKWEVNHKDTVPYMEKEYKCGVCGVGNWMSRPTCRGCKAKWADWNDTPKKPGNAANRDENVAKMEALQQVVEGMDDNPAIADTKQKIIDDIASLKKKTTDNRSLAQQLATVEKWAEREERKITSAEEELLQWKEDLDKRRSHFNGEKKKIAALKEAIAKDTEFKDADLEQELEMDIDVPVLQSKELEIRRQLNKKKDDKGVQFAPKRMKEMEKEADGIRDKIASAKRVKVNTPIGSPRTPEGLMPVKAQASTS
jgi:hypothetical protein